MADPLFENCCDYDILLLASIVSMQLNHARETAARIADPTLRARTDIWATVTEVEASAAAIAPPKRRQRALSTSRRP